jgi:5-formyltetrahydrofolate cyclo-ligase
MPTTPPTSAASAAAIAVLKRELRAHIREASSQTPASSVAAQSARLRESLLAHPAYTSATRVALYSSMPSEVDVTALIGHALANGKRVFLPRIVGARDMRLLEVASADEVYGWPPNSWGIREPPADGRAEVGDLSVGLDLVVVPGLAFDFGGGRCGYGKGFYDSFFARYHASHGGHMPSLVALALAHQVVDQVPMTELDWRVDEVIVASGCSSS